MAKVYKGRIRRTGRRYRAPYRRVSSVLRSVGKFSMPASNPYRTSRIGLNTFSNRFFPPLPPRMNVAVPAYGDTKYDLPIGNLAGPDGSGQTVCHYFWIDAISLANLINNAGPQGQSNFYGPHLISLFSVYKEAHLRTTTLSFSVTAEYAKNFGANPTANEINFKYDPVVQLAVCPMPLGYLKDANGAQHTAAQAGTVHFGVDYYSSLTQMKGAKTYVVPTSGDRNAQYGKMTIDGFDHNGEPMTIQSNNAWQPNSTFPVINVNFPAQEQRNVFLFAFRIRTLRYANVNQLIFPRFSYKMTQHLTYIDPTPPQPYVTANVA